MPAKSLQSSLSTVSLSNSLTPMTPNFAAASSAVAVPEEVLSNWQEYAVMLISSQANTGPESGAALTNLGDCLNHNGWVEAAHCWCACLFFHSSSAKPCCNSYLLSLQSSPIGGVGAPNIRIVLVGSQSPQQNPIFFKDPDTFVFSEIIEFALSLHVPAKGQEAFPGFPHLQAYRLLRAYNSRS